MADAIANLARRLEKQGVQQLLVSADPPSARIEVDGKPLGTSPSSVELTAGNHVVKVTADGYEPVERSFVMSTQRATEMTITLRPLPKVDAPVREEKAVAAAPRPEVAASIPPEPKRGRRLTWVAAGLAGAGLAAGVGMGLSSRAASDELRGSEHTREEADAIVGRAQGMATGANAPTPSPEPRPSPRPSSTSSSSSALLRALRRRTSSRPPQKRSRRRRRPNRLRKSRDGAMPSLESPSRALSCRRASSASG